MERTKDFRELNKEELFMVVGGGFSPWSVAMSLAWNVAKSGYKHRNDIMRGFEKGFK